MYKNNLSLALFVSLYASIYHRCRQCACVGVVLQRMSQTEFSRRLATGTLTSSSVAAQTITKLCSDPARAIQKAKVRHGWWLHYTKSPMSGFNAQRHYGFGVVYMLVIFIKTFIICMFKYLFLHAIYIVTLYFNNLLSISVLHKSNKPCVFIYAHIYLKVTVYTISRVLVQNYCNFLI